MLKMLLLLMMMMTAMDQFAHLRIFMHN